MAVPERSPLDQRQSDPPWLVDGLLDVEASLSRVVTTDDPFLSEVASHLIVAGGKRIRPTFTLIAAAIGDPARTDRDSLSREAIRGAVAVELVHLGALYHDDVIDDASTRRTVESVNARWGNLTAILGGDYLLAKASEIAASIGTEVAGLLASTIARLCEGEVLELRAAYDVGRSEANYRAAIHGKTAALFATACRIGAIVGGLDRPQIDSLTVFGEWYGMAFQVIDDVLDLVGTEEELGKPCGRDLIEGVYTLPVLQALATRTAGADRLRALLGRPLNEEELEGVRASVQTNGAVRRAIGTAGDFVAEATDALRALEQSASTGWLEQSAATLLNQVATYAND